MVSYPWQPVSIWIYCLDMSKTIWPKILKMIGIKNNIKILVESIIYEKGSSCIHSRAFHYAGFLLPRCRFWPEDCHFSSEMLRSKQTVRAFKQTSNWLSCVHWSITRYTRYIQCTDTHEISIYKLSMQYSFRHKYIERFPISLYLSVCKVSDSRLDPDLNVFGRGLLNYYTYFY